MAVADRCRPAARGQPLHPPRTSHHHAGLPHRPAVHSGTQDVLVTGRTRRSYRPAEDATAAAHRPLGQRSAPRRRAYLGRRAPRPPRGHPHPRRDRVPQKGPALRRRATPVHRHRGQDRKQPGRSFPRLHQRPRPRPDRPAPVPTRPRLVRPTAAPPPRRHPRRRRLRHQTPPGLGHDPRRTTSRAPRPLGHRRRSLRPRPSAARRPAPAPTRLRPGRGKQPPRPGQPRPHPHPRRRPGEGTQAHGLARLLRWRRRQRTPHLPVGLGHHRPRPPPLAADPPQPHHRRTGLLPVLVTHPGSTAHPGPRRLQPMERRGMLPDREDARRPGPLPGPRLDTLAPLYRPGHPRPGSPRRLRRHQPPTRPSIRPTGPTWHGADLGRDPPSDQRSSLRTGPRSRPRAALVHLATPPPRPRPPSPLPAKTSHRTVSVTGVLRPRTRGRWQRSVHPAPRQRTRPGPSHRKAGLPITRSPKRTER